MIVMVRAVDDPASPPSRGIGDGVANVMDALVRIDIIIIFPLAMA